jgi:hypothetical protein
VAGIVAVKKFHPRLTTPVPASSDLHSI